MSEGREIVCGRQPVLEVFRAGRRKVFQLFLSDGIKASPDVAEIKDAARDVRITGQVVGRDRLDGLTQGANHQGVAVEASAYPYFPEKELMTLAGRKQGSAFVLVVDHVQDPQNLGSLLRTAECAGVDAVIVPSDRAAGVTPAVVRASAGAAEHMRVCLVVNLVNAMRKLKEEQVWFYGLEALPQATLISETDFTGSVGLVVGAEDSGLGRLVKDNCDFLVKLPMYGKINSLNAGVAGAVAIYEVVKSRGQGKGDRVPPSPERSGGTSQGSGPTLAHGG